MKDTPLRRSLKARRGVTIQFRESTIPWTHTIEARHADYALPISIIWFRVIGNSTIDITSMFTQEKLRLCGLAGFLFESILKAYPWVTKVITASDTRYSRGWLKDRGFVRNQDHDLERSLVALKKSLAAPAKKKERKK